MITAGRQVFRFGNRFITGLSFIVTFLGFWGDDILRLMKKTYRNRMKSLIGRRAEIRIIGDEQNIITGRISGMDRDFLVVKNSDRMRFININQIKILDAESEGGDNV